MADVVALLAERREEIRAMGRLLNEMAATIGEESAERVLCEAIAAEARASGRKAAYADPGEPGLAKFLNAVAYRTDDGGMTEITGKIIGDRLTVGVGRCDVCPLYRTSSLPPAIAHALSCGREAPFAEGYDKRIKLLSIEHTPEADRSCRMIYRWDENAEVQAATRKTTLTVDN